MRAVMLGLLVLATVTLPWGPALWMVLFLGGVVVGGWPWTGTRQRWSRARGPGGSASL